jgi:hypothetical protein
MEDDMANKQSIQDVDASLDRWHTKLNMAIRKINELRDKPKKMVMGKIKVPAPAGVKVKIASNPGMTHAEFNDLIPSFGPAR